MRDRRREEGYFLEAIMSRFSRVRHSPMESAQTVCTLLERDQEGPAKIHKLFVSIDPTHVVLL